MTYLNMTSKEITHQKYSNSKSDPVVIQICPTASELSQIRTNIQCTEEGCTSIFHNSSNLEMHLIKTHNKESNYLNKKANDLVTQYFCPVSRCKYNLTPGAKLSEVRWFTKFKYLKQHYMKVHLEKTHICNGCQRSFVSEKEKICHEKLECGKKFTCFSCPLTYQSYLSLLAHCKRKNHLINSDFNRPLKLQKVNNKVRSSSGYPPGERPILPKPHKDSSVDIAAEALSELSRKVVVKGVDKSVQTVGGRKKGAPRLSKHDSRETQTVEKDSKISAETQTTAVYSRRKSTSRMRRRKKSMETQTNKQFQVSSSNYIISGFNETPKCQYQGNSALDDMIFPQFWSARNSSSTQTTPDIVQIVLDVRKGLNLDLFAENGNELSQLMKTGASARSEDPSELYTNDQIDRLIQQSTIFDETRSCNIETQTEVDFGEGFMDDCPILSNTETQTIQNAIDEYSNNYTQTCDDIFLNDFVEFSDIETQTAWANLTIESALVSAETQTAL